MDKPARKPPVQTSGSAEEAAADPRAGALRRTFEPNPSRNEAVPRKNAQRRTEPGHALGPVAPIDHSKE